MGRFLVHAWCCWDQRPSSHLNNRAIIHTCVQIHFQHALWPNRARRRHSRAPCTKHHTSHSPRLFKAPAVSRTLGTLHAEEDGPPHISPFRRRGKAGATQTVPPTSHCQDFPLQIKCIRGWYSAWPRRRMRPSNHRHNTRPWIKPFRRLCSRGASQRTPSTCHHLHTRRRFLHIPGLRRRLPSQSIRRTCQSEQFPPRDRCFLKDGSGPCFPCTSHSMNIPWYSIPFFCPPPRPRANRRKLPTCRRTPSTFLHLGMGGTSESSSTSLRTLRSRQTTTSVTRRTTTDVTQLDFSVCVVQSLMLAFECCDESFLALFSFGISTLI